MIRFLVINFCDFTYLFLLDIRYVTCSLLMNFLSSLRFCYVNYTFNELLHRLIFEAFIISKLVLSLELSTICKSLYVLVICVALFF